MLELNPFVKIAWNSNELKTQWAGRLNTTQQLSLDLEYQMVKQGFREANVYHMSPQTFDKQVEKITKDKLTFLPILRSRVYNGFSHKHFPVEKLDMNSFVYGVVARDLDTAQKFVEASEKGDHMVIGQLLGYPKCCCDAFSANWANKILDPCYEAAIKTAENMLDETGVHVRVHPYINPMLRYFGVKVSPFFPCSFSCDKAIKVGETWFSLMKSLNEQSATIVKELLEQPISWSLYKGIIYIKTPLFKGIVNGYYCEGQKNIVANQATKETGLS